MREGLIGAAFATGLGLLLPMFFAGPLAAQQSRAVMPAYKLYPHLNPDYQLAPSQIVQPIPQAVPVPGAPPIPKSELHERASARRAERRQADRRGGPRGVRQPRTRRRRAHHVVSCGGPFARNSSMAALAKTFHAQNVAFQEKQVQGSPVATTVLFPNDPQRRLQVWWANPDRTGTYLIDIKGKSTWIAPRGLRLGLTLAQLQRLNRKPFTLKGFDANDVASVADWNGGALAALPGGCKAGVRLEARSAAARNWPASEQYSSADRALRALRPRVSEILIGY